MNKANSKTRVDFNHDDAGLVDEIAVRWKKICDEMGNEVDLLSTVMDIKAANGVNENPALDLGRLIGFSGFDFSHDLSGISYYRNRETGKLEGWFRPRCAISEAEPA
jgi:hypothetical protein